MSSTSTKVLRKLQPAECLEPVEPQPLLKRELTVHKGSFPSGLQFVFSLSHIQASGQGCRAEIFQELVGQAGLETSENPQAHHLEMPGPGRVPLNEVPPCAIRS